MLQQISENEAKLRRYQAQLRGAPFWRFQRKKELRRALIRAQRREAAAVDLLGRPERRSRESLRARELAVVKRQAEEYEARLSALGESQTSAALKLRLHLELTRERERELLAELGAGKG